MEYHILECRRFVAADTGVSKPRTVHNYEWDYYCRGERTMVIDGQSHPISEDTLCFRRPGQKVYSSGPYDCYILTLDFSLETPTEHYFRHAATPVEPDISHPLLDELPEVLHPFHHSELLALFAELADQPDLAAQSAHLLADQILFLANADALRARYDRTRLPKTAADEVLSYLNTHFREPVTLDMLAAIAHLDRSYLVRLFRKQYGTSPIDYLIRLRIGYAADLLANTCLPVQEVAAACGYRSVPLFITHFKKRQCRTPLEYRRTVQSGM